MNSRQGKEPKAWLLNNVSMYAATNRFFLVVMFFDSAFDIYSYWSILFKIK